ncbi:MAG: Mrp/NBP35 family ATP-binding protein [Bacteroidia bacterium]|nr:Mrp/NBP35 family ATP-binding protein [Bacteroidia bacterium]MCZ2277689.1 Mrp/NBP35 family ATP-binding protein [Bacteroidia bacterium]
MSITKEQIIDALSHVEDPDFKKDLVALNMVKDVEVNGNKISFTVVLTTPACPLKEKIQNDCEQAIRDYVSKDAVIKINMTAQVTGRPADKSSMLPGIKNIIAVASGKGGVGKSTVASNLAVALASTGAKVGLADADIFGPSQTLMFGVVKERLFAEERNGKTYMIPLEKFGVKLVSIGFLVEKTQAIVWRGPMASKALTQLLCDTLWGEVDYLLVDLPPGTSDIHLTLASSFPVNGAVVVTTPQEVAMADARKGIDMFRKQGITIPVLGLIENMAYFTPAELPENKYYIFGKGGGVKLAAEMNVPLLGSVPLIQSVCEAGDNGIPVAYDPDIVEGKIFREIAYAMAQQLAISNAKIEDEKLAHANK